MVIGSTMNALFGVEAKRKPMRRSASFCMPA
jgi:hypothetical protein